MEDFIGINFRREDPVRHFRCAGFGREYRDWAIDEGDFYAFGGNNLGLFPNNNRYRWNPAFQGQTWVNFDAYYNSINGQNAILPDGFGLCASMFNCLPHLAGGNSPNEKLFKPVRNQNTGLALGSPAKIIPDPPMLDSDLLPSSYLQYADWIYNYTARYGMYQFPTFPTTLKFGIGETSVTGLGNMQYVEIWNEPDRFWISKNTRCNDLPLPPPFLPVTQEIINEDLNGDGQFTYAPIVNGGCPEQNFNCTTNNQPNGPPCTTFNFDEYDLRYITQFSAEEYAAMASAAYDGYFNDGTTGTFHTNSNGTATYNVGLRFASPAVANPVNAQASTSFVLGGISELDINWVDDVREWCETHRAGSGRVFPFDVVNLHHYSDACHEGVRSRGVHPEADIWDFARPCYDVDNLTDPNNPNNPNNPNYANANGAGTFLNMRDHLANIDQHIATTINEEVEFWLSEFGYDTNPASQQRAQPVVVNGNVVADQFEVQGRWMVRSYLEMAAAGVDRAMMFCIRDEFDGPTSGLFNNSGLVKVKEKNYERKKSWWYVHTMREVLRDTRFVQDLSPVCQIYDQPTAGQPRRAPDNTCRRVYRFAGNGRTVYALWIPTNANNTAIFDLTLPAGTTSATIVTMRDGDPNGVRLQIPNPANIINVAISENPVFVILNENSTDVGIPCVNYTGTEELTCDALRVTWTAPTPPNNATVESYQVYYALRGQIDPNAPGFVFNSSHPAIRTFTTELDGDFTSVVIPGLQECTEYWVFVRFLDSQDRLSEICPVEASTNKCHRGMLVPPAWVTSPLLVHEQQAEQRLLGYTINPYTDNNLTFNDCSLNKNVSLPTLPNGEVDAWVAWEQGVACPLPAGAINNNHFTVTFPANIFPNGIELYSLYLYDYDGQGELEIWLDPVGPAGFFLYENYRCILYQEWKAFTNFHPTQQRFSAIRFVKRDCDAKIGRILISAREGLQSRIACAIIVPDAVQMESPEKALVTWQAQERIAGYPELGKVEKYTIKYSGEADELGNPVNPKEVEVEVNTSESVHSFLIADETLDELPALAVRIYKCCCETVPPKEEGNEERSKKTGGAANAGKEKTQTEGLKIFPNPASNEVIVSSLEAGYTNLAVHDMEGKLILLKTISAGALSHNLDISGFADGVFMVSLRADGKNTLHGKLVKTKN